MAEYISVASESFSDQPTGELRWVRAGEASDGPPFTTSLWHGAGDQLRITVCLQQRWRVSRWEGDRCVERRDEWRDVPMVTE